MRDWREGSFMDEGSRVYWDSIRHTGRDQPLLGCVYNFKQFLSLISGKLIGRGTRTEERSPLGYWFQVQMGSAGAINWSSNHGEGSGLKNKDRWAETHRKECLTLDLKRPMIYYMRKQCTEQPQYNVVWVFLIHKKNTETPVAFALGYLWSSERSHLSWASNVSSHTALS